MKITNKLNLPQPFVELATSDYTYTDKEYRVTSLLKGFKEAILERRHGDEIEQDVSDMIWLLFGTAAHSVLEKQKEGVNELKETRLKQKFGDYTLSGQFDLYNAETETISDYKTCSVWKVVKSDYEDWRKQLLMYAYMLQEIGFPVKNGEIVAIMKDHSKQKAKTESGYPLYPVQKIEFKFNENDFRDIKEFIEGKFSILSYCETLEDDQIPECTPEQRYNTGDKYAVMKNGRKKALRLLDSAEEAGQWKYDNGGDYIEVRKGEDKKCAEYCSCSEFCNYWREKREIKTES